MRIAWFTPFQEESAIGRVSRAVTDELSRRAEVDIWHPRANRLLRTSLKTIECSSQGRVKTSLLEGYDAVFYNIGDHFRNHLEIFEASQLVPGVVVLHDLVLHHFFAEYYLDHRAAPETYCNRMEDYYGLHGREVAMRAIGGVGPPVWGTDAVADFPFFEDALLGSTAVVTHSNFARRRIRQHYVGPIQVLPLPYASLPCDKTGSRESLNLAPGQRLIVTIGHANENKRILDVLEALAALSPTSCDFVYAVVGQIDPAYRQRVLATATRSGIAERVRLFEGFVPDELFDDYLRHADLIVNLRRPPLEAASSSLVEAMFASKAVIVSDAGWYAELPDSCVRKVPAKATPADLAAALRDLLYDEQTRRELGRKAREHALLRHSAAQYCAGLLKLAVNLRNEEAPSEFRNITAPTLQSLGLDARQDLHRRYEREAEELFGVGDEPLQKFGAIRGSASSKVSAQLRHAAAGIGAMPPSPATLRARMGAILVSAVRRSLFWLIPQFERLHTLLIDGFTQQQGKIEHLQVSVEELQQERQQGATLSPLQSPDRTAAEAAERIRDLEARVDALSATVRELTLRDGIELSSQRGDSEADSHSAIEE